VSQATPNAGDCSDFRWNIVIYRARTRYGCDASWLIDDANVVA